MDSVFETHPGKIGLESQRFDVFIFWLHSNQMELMMWAVAHGLTALQAHALGFCGLEETPCLLSSLQGSCVLTSSCKEIQASHSPHSFILPVTLPFLELRMNQR